MLALTDPLWKKLDDAHRDLDIPELLSELAETWDDEAAKSLFWDCLCHQGTCYGATYAVIPHLLRIAEPEGNKHQRQEIAHFLGFVALRAFNLATGLPGESEKEPPQGLPLDLEAWDRKLDVYRSLMASLEDPDRANSDYEQKVSLPHYRRILETDPVDQDDLEKIRAIRREFFVALPGIRALCERALRENVQDKYAVTYLLSGVAAADGLIELAGFLSDGSEGGFKCASCGWQYETALFGDRVAIYADEDPPGNSSTRPIREDRRVQDYRDDVPSRSDGFMMPIRDIDENTDPRITALLALADQASNPEPALSLRSLLGSFVCSKCGAQGPVKRL